MSSRSNHPGSGRGRGGHGGFKHGGARVSSQKHRGVSLDGFMEAETTHGPFVNGQFRESGAEHMKKKKKGLTRKELRKKAKVERKERVQTHELQKRARKLGVDVEELKAKNSSDKKRKREDMEEEHQGLIDDYELEPEELTKAPTKKSLTRAEAKDEKIIKEMEKKLGLTGKGKKEIGDGLDFLFEGIGSDAEDDEGSQVEASSGEDSVEAPRVRRPLKSQDIFGKGWKKSDKSENSDDSDKDESGSEEDGEEMEMGSDLENDSGSDVDDSGDMEVDGDDDDESMNGEQDGEDADGGDDLESGSDFGLGIDDGSTDSEDDGSMFGRGNPYIKFDSESGESGEEDEENESELSSEESTSSASEEMPSLVSTSASAPKSGAYIPPALRARMAGQSNGEDAMKAQMLRELRGHVNRLSESNLESIFELIENMFSKYPRKSMSDELVRILVDDCISSVGGAVVFTFAPTYAALTMMLHLTIGAEVGGAVVQGCARELQNRIDQNDIAVSRNLLLMFINFYNFNIVHCSMVYDIIRLLIERMNEQNVDLLLLLIQKCGMSLRKDDALAIKDIINSVNEVTQTWKAAWDEYDPEKDESGEKMPARGKYTKRVQFMVESLTDVKNNKAVTYRDADSATTKMKASIEKYLKKRFKKVPSHESLRISWKDLVGSDHLGRWWVVGSATQIPSDQRADARKEQQLKQAMKEAKSSQKSKDGAPSIDDLARNQHMTTATRKAIFSIIVTSEDYVDACEKLTRFDSKDVKAREIVQVALQCCQQEQSWNPYYGHLLEKLCSLDAHFKISLKFLLWEKFDDFATSAPDAQSADKAAGMSVRALTNCAKLYAHLIGSQTMSPSLLKAFPFEQASAKAIVFLRMLLTTLFLEFDTMSILKMFVTAASAKGFGEFAQNFDIFLQTNMRTLKPEIVKQCRLGRPPHKVPDASSADHVRNTCNALKKALSQVNLD